MKDANPIDKQQAIKLLCGGMSLRQVAEVYGVSHEWIRQIAKKADIPSQYRGAAVRKNHNAQA